MSAFRRQVNLDEQASSSAARTRAALHAAPYLGERGEGGQPDIPAIPARAAVLTQLPVFRIPMPPAVESRGHFGLMDIRMLNALLAHRRPCYAESGIDGADDAKNGGASPDKAFDEYPYVGMALGTPGAPLDGVVTSTPTGRISLSDIYSRRILVRPRTNANGVPLYESMAAGQPDFGNMQMEVDPSQATSSCIGNCVRYAFVLCSPAFLRTGVPNASACRVAADQDADVGALVRGGDFHARPCVQCVVFCTESPTQVVPEWRFDGIRVPGSRVSTSRVIGRVRDSQSRMLRARPFDPTSLHRYLHPNGVSAGLKVIDAATLPVCELDAQMGMAW